MHTQSAVTPARNRIRQIGFALALCGLSVLIPYPMMAGQAPIDIGSTANFAILGGSGITSTGGGEIYGDVGLSPGGGSSIGVIQTQVHGVEWHLLKVLLQRP